MTNSLPHQSAMADAPVIEQGSHPGLGIAYLRAGAAGPAVVMLHGWGAFKELWWSTLRDLGRDHRCYALDVPGHGESRLERARTLDAVADRVAAFCDEFGLRRIVLIGHSLGGSIAVEMALRHPEVVQRLVLVDAAVDAHTMPSYSRAYLVPTFGWAYLRIAMTLGRIFMRPLGLRIPHEHGGGYLRPWFRRSSYLSTWDPYSLHLLLQALFAARAGERLGQIRVPTLVINGQLDQLVTPAHSQRIAAAIPGSTYVEIGGALHNPMDERPREFNQAVRVWLGDNR